MKQIRRGAWPERAYRRLLHLFPTDFRRRFGDQMAEYFRDRWNAELRTAGPAKTIRFCLHAVLDVTTAAFRERVSRRAPRYSIPSPTSQPTGDSMLQALSQDLRFSGRMLRKNPVITAVAVAVIALGTGAVSTIFSVANAIVLRAVPGVNRPDEIAIVERTQRDGGSQSASYPYYEHLAANTRKMSGVAAWSMVQLTMNAGGDGGGLTALGIVVSGNYFDLLGVKPALGRFFAGDETRVRSTYPVVVVSHGFWQRHLGGDSSAVGRSVLVNGSKFTVIGIAPEGFAGLLSILRTDAWVPLMMQRELRPRGDLSSEGSAWLEVFGRVAPGVSRAEAQAEMAALTDRWAKRAASAEIPHMKTFVAARLYDATGLPTDASGPMLGFFAVLLVVSALVLLIASVNVASMLLARAVARRGEIAVRLALGAAPGRLVRQLLTESVMLFALGGVGGTLLAVLGTRLLQRIELPVEVPLALDLSPDGRVLAFTLIVALLTGVIFGLAPALHAARLDLATGLRGDTSGAGHARSRLRNVLTVGQVALSLVLLSAAGLFLRALDRGRRVDTGFDAANVATASLDVRTSGYDAARGFQFYKTLKTRLAAMPGVIAVGYARVLPLTMSTSGTEVSVDAYAPPTRQAGAPFDVLVNFVDDGYFAVLRTPILRGRGILPTDDVDAPPVVVVNESFAKLLPPGAEIVGRTLRRDDVTATIVGVVRDAKFARLNRAPEPFVFLPMEQRSRRSDPGRGIDRPVTLMVRTAGDPAAIMPAIRREIRALDPNLPAPTLTTLSQATSVSLLPQRAAVAVTGVLGIAGLLLAAIGLYGVLAFSAAQRTRELGIRIALGAVPRDVLGLIVGEGMRLVGVGMAVGLALALVATRALAPFLFGVSPIDPLTFVAIGVVLAGTALLASYLPARRAARIDPVAAMRVG